MLQILGLWGSEDETTWWRLYVSLHVAAGLWPTVLGDECNVSITGASLAVYGMVSEMFERAPEPQSASFHPSTSPCHGRKSSFLFRCPSPRSRHRPCTLSSLRLGCVTRATYEMPVPHRYRPSCVLTRPLGTSVSNLRCIRFSAGNLPTLHFP